MCHAYFAAYGGMVDEKQLSDALILTADAWGDGKNWSVSIMNNEGRLETISSGDDFIVARIYKFCTLILGMKPNEHEYKVMGLSSYSLSRKHIEKVEKIFFDILDFKDGKFINKNPLKDSYFDLRDRLEGHRFDNIAAALQNWSSIITGKWAEFWLNETGKNGVVFSGGLSMNIKANGELLNNKHVKWISVPPSGGDESLSAGACFALNKEKEIETIPMNSPYLGEEATLSGDDWALRLDETSMHEEDFIILDNFDNKKVAKLIDKDLIIARCVGRSEFGARALGNRSILANPKNPENIKKINNLIKNRDFWMPFTPSILEEHADKYIINPKDINSPYMTIGYESKPKAKIDIPGCLHMGDGSARPQFVSKKLNYDFWSLISEFYKITDIPCLLNTSLNLHGEPMNYSVSDSVRTLALSSLDFLIIPNSKLLVKKRAENEIKDILKA